MEDTPADTEAIVLQLVKAGYRMELTCVATAADFEASLTNLHDLIVVGLENAELNAYKALQSVHERAPDVPVFVVSDIAHAAETLDLLKLGASDHIFKDRLGRIGPAAEHAIAARNARVEVQRLQAALRHSESERIRVLGSLGDVVWAFSLPENRFVYLSPAAERVFGRPVQDFLREATTWSSVVHPDDLDAVEMAGATTLRNGRSDMAFRVVFADGSVRHCQGQAWLIRDESGRPSRIEGITRDVTDRHRADEGVRALEASKQESEELRALNEFKTGFMNMIAHELNNPLVPMRLHLGIILRDAPDRLSDQQRKSLQALGSGMDKISGLLTDMLDTVRMQSGTLALRFEPLDVAGLARHTHEQFLPQARDAGIEFQVECPPQVPLAADARRLQQVLDNLVGNGIKFTPRGGRVHLAVQANAPMVQIRLRDTGRGIKAEDIPRLFQPFTRLEPESQDRHTGTGLGLFVCKGIVEQHGGTVECASDGLGKGATFTVNLPMNPRRPPAAKSPAHEVPSGKSREAGKVP